MAKTKHNSRIKTKSKFNLLRTDKHWTSTLTLIYTLGHPCITGRLAGCLFQPSFLHLRGCGQQWAPSWVLEDLIDVWALCMVVLRPLVPHHINEETTHCDEIFCQPTLSAIAKKPSSAQRRLTMYVVVRRRCTRRIIVSGHFIDGILITPPEWLA